MPRTVGELLARLGRVVLWLALVVVLVRGLADIVAVERPAPVPGVARAGAPVSWPDDAARAFAVEFVAAYLSHSPADAPDARARGLEAFASPELVGELLPRLSGHAEGESVRSATVARVVRLDDQRALVTVAATIAGAAGARRMVTVPIARDDRGGLVVDDLPSFASAIPRAAASMPELDVLVGPERGAIGDVVTRFLRAYLAGDTAGLAYLVPAGTRIAAAVGTFEVVDLASVNAAGPATRAGRLVLATVHARDVASRAIYGLRYRLLLVKRERWYVAEVNGPKEG